MKKLVIVGATSLIAEHCTRLWVQNDYEHIVLIARDANKLKTIANDLKTRSNKNITIETFAIDFNNLEEIKNSIQKSCENQVPNTILIAHGILCNNENCQKDLSLLVNNTYINSTTPILFVEGFLQFMKKENEGNIGIIGSVAGDRGRGSNYIYGATKSFLDTYVQGLNHSLRFNKSKIKISLIKPGPTKTPMTADVLNKGTLAEPQQVAQIIVKGMNKGKRVIYTPLKWKLIMFIVKHIPNFIFDKINI